MNGEQRSERLEFECLAGADVEHAGHLSNRELVAIEPRRLRQHAFRRKRGRRFRLARQEAVLLVNGFLFGTLGAVLAHPRDEAPERGRVDIGLLGVLRHGRPVVAIVVGQLHEPIGEARDLVPVVAHQEHSFDAAGRLVR